MSHVKKLFFFSKESYYEVLFKCNSLHHSSSFKNRHFVCNHFNGKPLNTQRSKTCDAHSC